MTEPGCLHQIFEAQAARLPEQVAISFRGKALTYQEVDQQSNRLARYLRAQGIKPGSLVGLYFERSELPILSILATLKAGAAYVPLDPNYPPDRIRHIMTEAEVALLLTEEALAPQASQFFEGETLVLDASEELLAAQSMERLSVEETGVTPEDLCYILYTSGTTGRPKGIMTEHRNVVRFAHSFNEVLRLTEKDRIYQGFSLGFDGSVEEMWMAFSNGATLVVGTPEVARLGNEAAKLMKAEGVTVFSTVPTFLSMITEDLPQLRLLIVSGEPCPPELIKKWVAPSRRMLNVYGPTETTVNTTVKECVPDVPVTIGRPLRGYQTYILDADMKPVPEGEPGELYIGGVGVSRGYFNQPELTAKHFLDDPFSEEEGARIYRTGDLVRLNEEGEIVFLGRIDKQVKIRGYRIELSEIESVLREHPAIHMAVVHVYEHDHLKELAAYIVLKEPAAAFDANEVIDLLRERLPAYMIPSYLDVLDELPMLSSGKVDRKRLPTPKQPLLRTDRKIIPPRNELEQKIASVWEEVLKRSPISVEDDFFLDLGGYSLLAAQVVSQLRNRFQIEVAIRALYQHTTIAKLAAHISEAAASQQAEPGAEAETEQPRRRLSQEVFEQSSAWQRWLTWTLQALLVLLGYGLGAAVLLVGIYFLLAVIWEIFPISWLIYLILFAVFFGFPLSILFSIAMKWLIIGRYKPGSYPLWSFYYFRWWLATRVQALSGMGFFAGTPVMNLYFRLMGAKVGKHCILNTGACVAFDLVTIGEDTCIGPETQLLGYRIEDGMLHLGRVDIGNRCFVGTHCVLALDTRMEDDTCLDDLSLLPDGAVLPAGERWRGSPAQPAEISLPPVSEEQAQDRNGLKWGWLHFLTLEVFSVFTLFTTIPFLLLWFGAYLWGGIPLLILTAYLSVPLGTFYYCLMIVGLKRFLLPKVEPGLYRVESWFYIRLWLVGLLLGASRQALHALYTTIYLPPWLRMLGAKIGKRAEISTISQMMPDLTVIGDESFFADGSMLVASRTYRGHVLLGTNKVGRRSFVGNNALLPPNASLGDNCLLGVLSTTPHGVGDHIPDETEWLGSPSFRLPYRKKVEGFDVSETFEPTTKLYIQRYIIDGLRILIPPLLGLTALIAFIFYVVYGFLHLQTWALFALTPLVSLALVLFLLLSVVIIKKLLMGTFEPVIKPLWCVYVWFNELLNGVYETVAAPLLLPLIGTPFFNWYLRLLGCKIGKHAFIETTLFSEFDLVEVGDYSILNAGVVVQNHLFEDRIMKSSRQRIGNNCSVGNMSIVLYDTEMEDGSVIAPLSLLMKGESLPPNSHWIGIPTSAARR